MLNSVNLIGRFTRDPELRGTASGLNTCSFTLAVDRNYGKGEERKADFINCVAWKQTAEVIARYFKKGNLIALEGSIQTRTWDDGDSARRYATEVVVNRIHFIESKKTREEQAGGNVDSGDNYGYNEYTRQPSVNDYGGVITTGTEDDLPF